MEAGSAGELGRRYGLEQVGFWRKLLEHPSYDSWWQQQAMDKILAAQPLKIPVMLVDSLWDQEDIYGATAVYRAIKPKDAGNDKVFLVMGPWHHGQEIGDGSKLGALNFNSDTGLYFRENILRPFLDQYLKDGAPKSDMAPVTAFETGTNTWRRLPSWPAGCASGCTDSRDSSLSSGWAQSRFRRAQGRRGRPEVHHMTSTFLIRLSPCLSARARFSPWDMAVTSPGRSGWSMISGKLLGVRMCWLLHLMC